MVRWLDSPICYISKRIGENKLLGYAKLLKPFTLIPLLDNRSKEIIKIFNEMIEFETDNKMKARWTAFRDIVHVLLTDGAYKTRILLLAYKIFERYDRITLLPTEIYAIDGKLNSQGKLPLLSKV